MKGNRYGGGMTVHQDHSKLKIGDSSAILSKEQRKQITTAIALLTDARDTTTKVHALYNLSEVFKTVHRIGQELNKK